LYRRRQINQASPFRSKCCGSASNQIDRHTSTSIYHAYRGSGTTMIDGEPFHWQKGDTFIVTLWSWHEHANASSSGSDFVFDAR